MYVGSQAVDSIYIGDQQVDAVYLGDTLVWSAIPADVKAHIARVMADGGTVPEQAKMVSMVKKLIAANLWNNCVFFGLPLGGVKKDGNQYVSKVYDLKANADLAQATGTKQPKYDNGNLLYDGGDYLQSATLDTNNNIRNAVANMSVFVSVNYKVGAFVECPATRAYHAGTPVRCAWMLILDNGNRARVDISNGVIGIAKQFISTSSFKDETWQTFGFVFDGNSSIGGKIGFFKCYGNGIGMVGAMTVNNNMTSINNCDEPIMFGTNGNLAYGTKSGNKTGMLLQFNKTLSDSESLIVHNIMMGV